VIGIAACSAVLVSFAVRHLSGYMKSPRVEIDRTELWALRRPMLLTGIGGQMNLLTDYIVVSLVADRLRSLPSRLLSAS